MLLLYSRHQLVHLLQVSFRRSNYFAFLFSFFIVLSLYLVSVTGSVIKIFFEFFCFVPTILNCEYVLILFLWAHSSASSNNLCLCTLGQTLPYYYLWGFFTSFFDWVSIKPTIFGFILTLIVRIAFLVESIALLAYNGHSMAIFQIPNMMVDITGHHPSKTLQSPLGSQIGTFAVAVFTGIRISQSKIYSSNDHDLYR